MHPDTVIALARLRERQTLEQHQFRHHDLDARQGGRRPALARARSSLGSALVAAGTRLLVVDAQPAARRCAS